MQGLRSWGFPRPTLPSPINFLIDPPISFQGSSSHCPTHGPCKLTHFHGGKRPPSIACPSCTSKLPLPLGQFHLSIPAIAPFPSQSSHQTQEQHSVTAERLDSEDRMLEAAYPLSKERLADLEKFWNSLSLSFLKCKIRIKFLPHRAMIGMK